MTSRERAAFNAGIEACRQMVMVTAITLETREGSAGLRSRAAVAALHGLAEGLDALMLGREQYPLLATIAAIKADPASSGENSCPSCTGRLRWTKDANNSHIHAECETAGCLRVMQ